MVPSAATEWSSARSRPYGRCQATASLLSGKSWVVAVVAVAVAAAAAVAVEHVAVAVVVVVVAVVVVAVVARMAGAGSRCCCQGLA